MNEISPKIGDTVKRFHTFYSNEGPGNRPKELEGDVTCKVLAVYPDGCLDLEVTAPKATPAVVQEKVSPRTAGYKWGWFVDDLR